MDLKKELKAGDEIPVHIAPFGEYPAATVDGKEIVEKFTKEVFQKVIEDWRKNGEKLIRADFDHKSETTDSTVASGWIKDLRIDDEKGLVGTLIVSESGANSLNGLDYRFGSPTFALDEENKPSSLLSFAFTNRPRLTNLDAVYNSLSPSTKKEKIVMNEEIKEEVKTETEPAEEVKEEVKEEVIEKAEETKPETDDLIVKIKGILALPEEAAGEDIIKSITELVERVKAITDAEIEAEAKEVIDACGVDEEKKGEVLNSYKENPALVKKVLSAFTGNKKPLVCNAAEAVKPDLADKAKLKAEFDALKGGTEKLNWLKKHPGFGA